MGFSQKLASLFYEIRAETTSLPGDLAAAERHLGKLTDFVRRNPTAAMGALATATIAVGAAATKMALDVERSLDVVARKVPGATGQMQGLRDQIRAISLEQARTQSELATAAKQIADQGVGSLEEVQQRLAAATRAADATGTEITTVISGLDQTLDLFGKSGKESEAVLQRLFAVSQGKMPLADMFAALQRAAPAIKSLGIDFDTAAAALGGLLEEGKTARQAASELKALGERGAEGRKQIELLADAFGRGRDATREYNAAIIEARTSTDALWAQAKNNLSAVMIDLGQQILPTVTKELQGIVGVLNVLNGTISGIKSDSLVATLTTPAARAKMSLDEVRQSIAAVVDAWTRGNLTSLQALKPDQLKALRELVSGEMSKQGPKSQTIYATMIADIDKLIAKHSELADAQAKTGTGKTTGTGRLTAEQLAAAEKLREEQQKALNKQLEKENELREKSADLIARAARRLAHDIVDDTDVRQLREAADAGEKKGVFTSDEAARMRTLANVLDLEMRTTKQKEMQADLQRDLNEFFDAKEADMERQVREQKDANEQQRKADEARKTHVKDLILDLARGAAAVLQIASAFGLVDQKLGVVLQSLQQMGDGIKDIAAGDKINGVLKVAASLATLIKSAADQVFGHPGRERAAAFRRQLAEAREEWELTMAALGDDVSGRSPLQQELVNLDRQAEQMRRRAAAEFLPQGERDPRAGMTIAELNEAIAAAKRRGHHAGAEGIAAYRDALIQIEELFNAKEQLAGRRDAEQQRDAAQAAAGDQESTASRGLASLSYSQGDTFVSLQRQILAVEMQERDILNNLLASITGQSVTLAAPNVPASFGSVSAGSITIGSINVQVHMTGGGDVAAATEQAVIQGIDRGLAAIRRDHRSAAGAPRYS